MIMKKKLYNFNKLTQKLFNNKIKKNNNCKQKIKFNNNKYRKNKNKYVKTGEIII